ncbi:MAG: hypothetical protein K9J30_15365 [Bacteroidales bacterium]|nr:hypothetical protein [Bacteroidales bacterium]
MPGCSDTNDWIHERLLEIEGHKVNGDTLPFKIIETKDAGFLAKVKGLYAYISFYHMPWKYYSINSWTAIAPSLTGKTFFCKIHKVDKDHKAILLNGEFPQFRKAELTTGEEYTGLIIEITGSGLIIDIGSHFDWKYGSLTGFLHASKLADNRKTSDFNSGQKITVLYQEAHENGQLIFCADRERMDWQMGIPQGLVGQTMWAKVTRQPGSKKVEILVRGRYKSKLIVDKQTTTTQHKKKIKKLKNELADGDLINCGVTGFDKKGRTLMVDWSIDLDDDSFYENSISNNLDSDTRDVLSNLKRQDLKRSD